jgi:putative flippase GtrA
MTTQINVDPMNRSLWYACFAMLAIIANIGAQELSAQLYQGSFYIALSVINGTWVGLATKYWLDKTFIFQFQTQNLQHESRTFLLYSLMGLFTTAIFWGFEFGFEYLFQDKYLRYLGGIIGLITGYIIKYHLDKRFVFVEEA